MSEKPPIFPAWLLSGWRVSKSFSEQLACWVGTATPAAWTSPRGAAGSARSPPSTQNSATAKGAVMSMFIGESLIGEGNEVAHIDLLIGSKTGPVGTAFA